MCHAYDFTNEMDDVLNDLKWEEIKNPDDSDDCYYDALADFVDSMEDEFINTLMEGYK
jgi:hypothetical protein